jgi:hypothetical protein
MNVTAILNQIESHAAASGLFERVNKHEPKNAPGNGLTCAIWAQAIGPYPAGSSLAATTGRLVFNVRVYTSMLSEPQDAIDPNLLTAVDLLMTAYSGDFELGSTVKNVDLMGESGTPLSATAGYLNIDNKIYRVMTILLPVIVNDIWTQGA